MFITVVVLSFILVPCHEQSAHDYFHFAVKHSWHEKIPPTEEQLLRMNNQLKDIKKKAPYIFPWVKEHVSNTWDVIHNERIFEPK